MSKSQLHNYNKNDKFSKVKKLWCQKIISWYEKNKRVLPWRRKEKQDFYNIWISEVMLQQTGVKTVENYFEKFIRKWPNLDSLFKANLDEILFIWQGMGYYQRARNLFKTLQILKKKKININHNELLKLPGIGAYTAASISAILNDENHAVVDGNIRRIFSRCFNIDYKKKGGMKLINEKAQSLTPMKNNRFYCQSLMDIGSGICRPRNPKCNLCPVKNFCNFFLYDKKEVKPKKRKRIKKIAITFFLKFENKVFMQKSNDNFLHGLMRLPISEIKTVNSHKNNKIQKEKLIKYFFDSISIKEKYINFGSIDHKFTSFDLNLTIIKILLKKKRYITDGLWINEKAIFDYPISKLMDKVIVRVLKQ